MNGAPKTAVTAIVLVILATLLRGLLGVSLTAGLLIAFIAGLWGASAMYGTGRSMRNFSIALMIYGGGFLVQAIALPQYYGSRELDAIWGALLVGVGVFLLKSPALKTYYANRVAVAEQHTERT